MKRRFLFIALAVIFIFGILPKRAKCQTYCNPLNLTSQFNSATSSGFGIADPTVVLFRDNYFLFATNAGGYWYSSDLLSWKFVTSPNLPFEKMAPTAFVIGDWIYFCSSFSNTIFRSNDPISGKWEVYCDNSVLLSLINDFAIFVDTDGRVYCYYGCSNNDGVMARELDPKNQFNPLGVPVVCSKINPLKKAKTQKPLQENLYKPDAKAVSGSWMNKYNGKYYYQCTEPIGDMNSLSDMVYVSESPLGPFTFAANNPFSYRPEGFVSGVANGSTFQDKFGNWWHIATITPLGNNQTPTKIGLFPAGFDKEGNLFTKTDFGDYPIVLPRQKYSDVDKLDPEWALLTDKSTAQASSSIALGPATSAFDENMSTYWSSRTGQKGEWLMVDLGSVYTINAFQINFAERKTEVSGDDGIFAYQYLIEYSTDRKNWMNLSDRTTNTVFETNPYEASRITVEAQYIKITNYHVPAGSFAISEFRIFGSGTERKPKKVSKFRAVRDYRNPQIVKMSWKKQTNTSGYNIRYGTDKDKLYHSYQVGKKTRLTVHCPDKNKTYWFQMDAFNENGVTPGKTIPLK